MRRRAGSPTNKTVAVTSEARLLADTEHWFWKRGIPHFIEDYRVTDDVFTRITPLLIVVFVLEVAGAIDLTWTWWQNLLAIAAALALVLAIWVLVNRQRGRKLLRLPDDVGGVELAIFIVVPALLPLVFNQQVTSAVVTLVANAALVVVASFVVGYGIAPMTRWALGQTYRQIGDVVDLFARSLPLLLLFTIVLFINTEVWQVASSLEGGLFWAAGAFFVATGTIFLLIRLPRELATLREQLGGQSAVDACADSPLANVAADIASSVEPAPMARRQEWNVLLVLLFSQAVQVVLVTLSIVAFFIVFGVVVIRPEVIESWLGIDNVADHALVAWRAFGTDLAVTPELVRVSGFLGALSGLYFIVSVITDSTYRDEFFDDVVRDVRQSIAVRNVYLALRAVHSERVDDASNTAASEGGDRVWGRVVDEEGVETAE